MNQFTDNSIKQSHSDFIECFDNFTLVIRTLQGAGIRKVWHANTGRFWFIDDAATKVNSTFWQAKAGYANAMKKVGSRIPPLEDTPFTKCSLIELAVVTVQPVQCDPQNDAIELNARLAYLCAIMFMSKRLGVSADQPLKNVSKMLVSNHVEMLKSHKFYDISKVISQNVNSWQLMLEH
jgi:hypothetical protein